MEPAIKENDPGQFHLMDDDGKLICTKFSSEDARPVERHETFGRELHDGCEKALGQKEEIQNILEGVDVDE